MITTERLIIEPLSYQELLRYVFGRKGSVTTDEDEDWTIHNVIAPMREADDEDYLYYTFWVAKTKEGEPVADFGFKGLPNEFGMVEIGYHVFEPQRNKGYATEMVGGMIDWLKEDKLTSFALATVYDHNAFSAKVLMNNGFRHINVLNNCVTFIKQIKF